MKTFKILVLFLLLCDVGVAQSAYRPGFVITNHGDTVQGLTDYREGNRNFNQCNFKSNRDEKPTVYLPGEILGYGFSEGRYYQSRVLPEDSTRGKVFLEYLVIGSASLYVFEGTFYVSKDGQVLHPLRNETQDRDIDGKALQVQSTRHIGSLLYILADCPEITGQIHKIELKEDELIKLIGNYNHCVNSPSVTYTARIPAFQVAVGAVLGAVLQENYYIDRVGNNDYPQYTNDFERSSSPVFGLSIELLFPRSSERLSIVSNLLFSSASHRTFYTTSNTITTTSHDTSIKLNELWVPLGFRYTFPGKIAPFLNLGFGAIINMNSRSTYTVGILRFGQSQIQQMEAIEFRKAQLGVWAGAGIKWPVGSRWSGYFEFRYGQTDGFTSVNFLREYNLVSHVSNLHLVLGAEFK